MGKADLSAVAGRIAGMKERFRRIDDELTDDVTVVVRGGDLEPEVLRADASRNFAVYGSWGISVFAARGITLDELAQQPPLIRFERLTLMTVGAIRAAGLRLDPTGRNPRHFDVTFDDLADGIARLIGSAWPRRGRCPAMRASNDGQPVP